MVEKNLSFEDLLEEGKIFTFLAGAGCSINQPSNLLGSTQLKNEIIKFTCAKSEIESICEIEGLRFEILLEIIRNLFVDCFRLNS